MLHIPQNKKEHSESPEKDQWKVAHSKAHQSIMNDPRNSLVTKRWVKSIEGIVAPCVAEDKAKIDKETGELVELKKSCHQLQGTCWRLGWDGCIGVCRKGGSARACWRQRLLPAALSCSCGVEWHTRIRAQGLGFRAARRDSISRAWRHKA